MEKIFRKALVIGKFQPLHKGHMSLIDFAAKNAERVVVCITAHAGEFIPMEQRRIWIEETYRDRSEIEVIALSYDPQHLNESSESDYRSSQEWADFLRESLGNYFNSINAIIGSEQYVQYMADYIGIDYIIYDQERSNMPISATDIKCDIIRNWDYLEPAVKRTYARHICICGSESSGKTTTCQQIEAAFSFVTMIPEIGRCLVGKSELCSEETLKTIYKIHLNLLKAVKEDPPTPIILWDTDTLPLCRTTHSSSRR